MYTNFKVGARLTNVIFLVEVFQKVTKHGIFDPFFFKNLPKAQECLSNCVFIVFWERSDNQFGQPKTKKIQLNIRETFERPLPSSTDTSEARPSSAFEKDFSPLKFFFWHHCPNFLFLDAVRTCYFLLNSPPTIKMISNVKMSNSEEL